MVDARKDSFFKAAGAVRKAGAADDAGAPPAHAAGEARSWLTDTLDWLDLWHSAAASDELAGDPPS